jgi:hypothetical protein
MARESAIIRFIMQYHLAGHRAEVSIDDGALDRAAQDALADLAVPADRASINCVYAIRHEHLRRAFHVDGSYCGPEMAAPMVDRLRAEPIPSAGQ